MNNNKKKRLAVGFIVKISILIIVFVTVLNFTLCSYIRRKTSELYSEMMAQIVQAHVSELSNWISIYTTDIKKYAEADIVKTGSNQAVIDYLHENYKNQNSAWSYVFFAGKDGQSHLASGEKGAYVGDRAYYTEIMDNKKSSCIGNPIISRTTGEKLFHISQAAVDKDGNVFGVFVGTLTLDTLELMTSSIKIGQTGSCIVLSGDGNLIASNDQGLILNVNYTDSQFLSKSKGLDLIAKSMLNGESGAGEYKNEKNKKIIVNYKPIENTPGWSLAIEVDDSQIQSLADAVRQIAIFVGFFICIILAALSWFLLMRIIKPLKLVEGTINEIAEGDADLTKTIEINRDDEIGRVVDGFNVFVKKLRSIVTNLKNSQTDLSTVDKELQVTIGDTTSAITQILASIQSVSSQVNNQAGSVEETAGAVTEIAQNIKSLEKMIENQSSSVTEASAAIEEMIGNISSVDQSVSKMAEAFSALEANAIVGMEKQTDVNERVMQIANQSEMLLEANMAIANIASQTNMLAMNAAIEAAHAGDAGRGFSVVADEIRKLSETSSEQSKTIGDELKKIQNAIDEVVKASNESEETFSAVSTRIRETDELVRQIKAAMDEQKEGSSQIFEALRLMNDNTSEVRSSATEMSVGNKAILEEVTVLQNATGVIRDSMAEMEAGAAQINTTGVNLSDMSKEMKRSLSQISGEIDLFKV